jgi:hypothetical protein
MIHCSVLYVTSMICVSLFLLRMVMYFAAMLVAGYEVQSKKVTLKGRVQSSFDKHSAEERVSFI